MHLDYSNQGRRPTAAQIVADWKRGGKPDNFTVAYGETFAEFSLRRGHSAFGLKGLDRWDDSGNGCRGVDRTAVVKALVAAGV